MNCTRLSKQEYEQWKSENYSGIGGSDAAGIMSSSSYSSPFKVWKEKMYGRTQVSSKNTKAGILFEDAIAKNFADENPQFRVEIADCIYAHKEHPFLIANIDRLLIEEETGKHFVLEIKNTRQENEHKWHNAIPDQYYWQIIHYLLVLQVEKAYAHCCIGGWEFVTLEFSYEDYKDDIDLLLNKEIEFWNSYVLTRTSPPVDGTEATTVAVNEVILDEVKTEKLPNKLNQYIEERFILSNKIKELTDQKSLIDNLIKSGLKSYGKFENSAYVVNIRKQSTKRFTVDKFKQENPSLYKSYEVINSFPVMTIKIKKEKE